MRPLVLSLLLLVAACGNPRRDQVLARAPQTRPQAAAQLRAALGEGGVNLRHVRVEESALCFEEYYPENQPMGDPAAQWIARTLDYSEISQVAAAETDGQWRLEVRCQAGTVTLRLDAREAAVKGG
ncbi:hypothetical protein EDM80_16050 [bacterium]|nr:MAG: hypothetical protein EDM80_16050 [bacterium]